MDSFDYIPLTNPFLMRNVLTQHLKKRLFLSRRESVWSRFRTVNWNVLRQVSKLLRKFICKLHWSQNYMINKKRIRFQCAYRVEAKIWTHESKRSANVYRYFRAVLILMSPDFGDPPKNIYPTLYMIRTLKMNSFFCISCNFEIHGVYEK